MTWTNPYQTIIDWLDSPAGETWSREEMKYRRHANALYIRGEATGDNTIIRHQYISPRNELAMPGLFTTKVTEECINCRSGRDHPKNKRYVDVFDFRVVGPENKRPSHFA